LFALTVDVAPPTTVTVAVARVGTALTVGPVYVAPVPDGNWVVANRSAAAKLYLCDPEASSPGCVVYEYVTPFA